MRNRNNIKYFALLIVTIGLSYLSYKGYRNYQRNEIIKEENTNLIYADENSKFRKLTYTKLEYDLNNSLLDSIGRIKDLSMTEFLSRTKEKIFFFDLDKDTLNIKKANGQKYNYSSKLDKGIYDKKFNDFLFNSLKPLLLKNGIDEIEVYTLTSSEFDRIPPPPGTLANFDIEEELKILSEKLGIDD